MGKYFRFFHVYPPKMKIVVTVFALHLQKKMITMLACHLIRDVLALSLDQYELTPSSQ